MRSMNEISIPETTITPEQYDINARQLVATILLRATRDYCRTQSDSKRNAIIKDLRSYHMDFMSSGMSVVVAEQLEQHCDEIRERILKEVDEED